MCGEFGIDESRIQSILSVQAALAHPHPHYSLRLNRQVKQQETSASTFS
jgi:hypothetical protein